MAGYPATVMAAGHASGLLAGDPALLLVAAEHYRQTRRLPQLAWVLEDAAVLLAGRGAADAARAAYAEAIEVYTNLGAEWDVIRADARVRAAGIHRGPRRPRPRATTGWAALSPTETKIAYLVAEGRSNPDIGAALFLSRRTVQTHVSHIMVKLGVRSRTEVAREAGLHPAPHAARHPGDRHAADRGSLA
jgi:DNA-binding CsgD family transcriptional regulator